MLCITEHALDTLPFETIVYDAAFIAARRVKILPEL